MAFNLPGNIPTKKPTGNPNPLFKKKEVNTEEPMQKQTTTPNIPPPASKKSAPSDESNAFQAVVKPKFSFKKKVESAIASEETQKQQEQEARFKEAQNQQEETPKEETPKEETPKEETPKEETPKEEDTPQEPKKSNRGRKPKKQLEEQDEEKQPPENLHATDSNREKILTKIMSIKSFDEIEERLFDTFNDPEWETLKENIATINSKIILSSDMTSDQVKHTLHELACLRDIILLPYINYTTKLQSLTCEKPKGHIERVMALCATGTNDTERKRSGIIAALEYVQEDGEIINLFEALDEMRARHIFLKAIMDSISFKAGALITMTGALKQEADLTR